MSAPRSQGTGPQPSEGREAALCPVSLYDRAAVRDPHPVYRRVRDAGPVVRLPRHLPLALIPRGS